MSGSFQRIAAVAQSVEQRTENPRVISSILIGGKRGLSKSVLFDNPFFIDCRMLYVNYKNKAGTSIFWIRRFS
jgi:hypothetical protein